MNYGVLFLILGVIGDLIFIPWLAYQERKGLSKKYQLIGCGVAVAMFICAAYFIFRNPDVTSHEIQDTVMNADVEEADRKLPIQTLLSALESAVIKVFGEDNYTISFDAGFITVNVWNAQAATILNHLYHGIDDPKYGWADCVKTIQDCTKILQNAVDTHSDETAQVIINLMDYDKHDVLWVKCNAGSVLYNVADDLTVIREENPSEIEVDSIPETEYQTEPKIEVPSDTPTPIHDDKWYVRFSMENEARSIINQNYTLTTIDNVSVNENLGTVEDGDYILLVYLTWNQQNGAAQTKKVLSMYSEDFAARIGSDLPDVCEISIFWTVPYYSTTDTIVKYSYERRNGGMYQTDMMISSMLN